MLEIACFELTSTEIALNSVADRIEFCSAIRKYEQFANAEEIRMLKAGMGNPAPHIL